MVEHQSLVNLTDWHVNAFSIQSTDKATLLANNAFDASVWELWPYLIKGACVIPAQLDLLLQKGLWQWFNDKDISISFLPTPIIDNYSLTSTPTMTHLRYLLTGGINYVIVPTRYLAH
jgi:non-ribosomal peptide synthetase component F